MFSISRRVLQRPSWQTVATPLRSIHTGSQSTLSPLTLRSSRSCAKSRRVELQKRHYAQYSDRNTVGVFTPTSAAIFVAVGAGLFFYFRQEKARLVEEREKERENKQFGRPNIGGPFSLTTHDGKPFTEKDLLGKWNLVYFGFTNCPDICPAELDKMTTVLDSVEKEHGDIFQPLFITVDPARDSPARIEKYLQDFHSSFIGLVGDYQTTKAACKGFRVYFSTPPDADPKGDYLVDHSIFVYLMDPEGKFVEALGQSVDSNQVIEKIREAITEWQKDTGRKV
ncbi:SCO1/SenC-domain-containing protein [Crucibulum laeve]|uniref:SCO1/SenC-domain-containing protein n=1 Tax=Crucibulum laeve TaxID=68775 RepID=A0A5C3LRQ0_9AGAR|nr:SCO1/SenC-domain-containing protein [Crucibulum laeve]